MQYVKDKAMADVVQDAIELYILDTTMPHLERDDRRDVLAYSAEEMVRRSEVKVKMRFYSSSTPRELAEGK